ncbi:MAG TPA: septum formation initiator family protein [Acidimicrobiales bacterium]|nr:septum formation initiator family protein [Acidimicrobiales bacterium]
MVAGAAVVSVVVVAAWFPASALYHQHQQLASTSAQLAELRHQDKALDQERKKLSSSTEIERIARQQYGLVKPGQQAYEVLPASKGGSGSGADAPDPGDPGLTAPVVPSGTSELPAGSGRPAGGGSGAGDASTGRSGDTGSGTAGSGTGGSGTGGSGTAGSRGGGPGGTGTSGTSGTSGAATDGSSEGSGSASQPSGVLGRIEQTLEFWR